MATITSLGAGTNLGLDTLYSSLQTAEQAKLKPLTNQQTAYKAQLTSWGVVQTALTKVQSAAVALKNASTIASSKVTSTNTAFTVSLSSTAAAGNYSVDVNQLASAQSLLSKPVASKNTALGDSSLDSRTITISQHGQQTPLTVTLGKDQSSLSDIRDAINKQQGSVSAGIIKADDNTYYLSLTARDTGTANAMSVTTSDAALSAYISYSSGANNNGMTEQAPARDASLKVNGVTITRASNTITDAPEGVTLNLLKQTGKDTPEALTVSKDTQPMTTAVQAYVDAYNSLQTTIDNQTKYTMVKAGAAQDSGNGALLGDNALRNIQTGLRSLLSTSQSGTGITTLSQIGVTQDLKGRLTIDTTKLDKALREKGGDVVKFLAGDGTATGFATMVSNRLDKVLGANGSLQNATSGINTLLNKVSDSYNRVNDQITATMARYKAQFTSLSKMVSSMNQTSNYLKVQFKKL